jgi:hypothetical protein
VALAGLREGSGSAHPFNADDRLQPGRQAVRAYGGRIDDQFSAVLRVVDSNDGRSAAVQGTEHAQQRRVVSVCKPDGELDLPGFDGDWILWIPRFIA